MGSRGGGPPMALRPAGLGNKEWTAAHCRGRADAAGHRSRRRLMKGNVTICAQEIRVADRLAMLR